MPQGSHWVCHGVTQTNKAKWFPWVSFDHFWCKHDFFSLLGQKQKLLRAYNQTQNLICSQSYKTFFRFPIFTVKLGHFLLLFSISNKHVSLIVKKEIFFVSEEKKFNGNDYWLSLSKTKKRFEQFSDK